MPGGTPATKSTTIFLLFNMVTNLWADSQIWIDMLIVESNKSMVAPSQDMRSWYIGPHSIAASPE